MREWDRGRVGEVQGRPAFMMEGRKAADHQEYPGILFVAGDRQVQLRGTEDAAVADLLAVANDLELPSG